MTGLRCAILAVAVLGVPAGWAQDSAASGTAVQLEPFTVIGQPDALDQAERRLFLLMERQPCLGCDARRIERQPGPLAQFMRWAFLGSEPAAVDEAAVLQYQIKYDNKLGLDRLTPGAPGIK